MQKININGNQYEVQLYRKNIKNLYIQIKNSVVVIKAPIKLSDKKISEFIKEKSSWIENAIKKEKLYNKNRIIESEITEQLRVELLENIKICVEKYKNILNVSPKKVTIKSMKTAWGSCTSNKNISFNIKLAVVTKKELEYVVLHEMTHLIHMNHSKDFWNTVYQNMVEYKIYRKMLRERK